jgi:CRP-like cAMP-binding protein
MTHFIWMESNEGGSVNSINPNYFIHAGNVLLLVAYSVRDILWLRLFAVAASLITLPFFILQPKPLWAPLSWTVIFAGLNLFQSWRLLVERRPVKLTAEEEEVHKLVFSDLPPRKMLQVLSIGSWITAGAGERLIESGKSVEAISLLVQGKVRIIQNKQVLGDLSGGNIVGSALILSGAQAEVDAVVTEPIRAIRWEVATLQRYLGSNPEIRIMMQQHLARDLAGKLASYADQSKTTGTS